MKPQLSNHKRTLFDAGHPAFGAHPLCGVTRTLIRRVSVLPVCRRQRTAGVGFPNQLVDPVSTSVYLAFASKDSLPMPRQRKSASLCQLPLDAFPRVQLCGRRRRLALAGVRRR